MHVHFFIFLFSNAFADCLTKSREGHISGLYFYDVSQRLEQALSDANEKASIEGGEYLLKLVRNLLMIISRTARLLECLVRI